MLVLRENMNSQIHNVVYWYPFLVREAVFDNDKTRMIISHSRSELRKNALESGFKPGHFTLDAVQNYRVLPDS